MKDGNSLQPRDAFEVAGDLEAQGIRCRITQSVIGGCVIHAATDKLHDRRLIVDYAERRPLRCRTGSGHNALSLYSAMLELF